MFLTGYELTNFEVTAEIIWKDLHLYNRSEGYQYGLKIIQINSQFKRGENFDPPPFQFRTSPPD
jgi:hypothetical protein